MSSFISQVRFKTEKKFIMIKTSVFRRMWWCSYFWLKSRDEVEFCLLSFCRKQTLWKLKPLNNINFKLQCNFRNFCFWNSNLVWHRPRITEGLTSKWKIFLKFVQELVVSTFLLLNLLLTVLFCGPLRKKIYFKLLN